MAHPGRLRITLVSLILAAFLAAGCGGGGDDVSRSTHDMLQEELDAALALVMQTETARDAARAEVTRLTGELATANTSISSLTTELATAKTSVTSLTDDLSDAEADVTRLTNQIGTATDATSLQGMLAAANARVTKLTTDLATANGQVTTLTGQLTVAQSEAASLRRLLTAAQTQVTEERDRADQAEVDAQAEITQQVQQQTQGLEANQRAQNLKEAFPSTDSALTGTDSPVTVTAPTASSLRLVRGGHSTATLSGSGTRSATMRLTSGADSGKTVVYTDRELRRTLLGHYGQHKDADAPQFDVVAATLLTLGDSGSDVTDTDGITFSHGLRSSLSATTQTDNASGVIVPDPDNAPTLSPTLTGRMLKREAEFFTGSIHGVGGRFYCVTDGCEITVTGTYNDDVMGAVDPDENDLDMVTVAAPGGLRFRPSSGTSTVTLCDDVTRCTGGTDQQYMVFGYWREDPTSAAAGYRVGVFGEAFNDGSPQSLPGTITATYDGTAVGMYVEQDPTNPVDTHRQGEFTADVDLRVNGGANTITGTIDDFVATPTGSSAAPRTANRWVVSLNASNAIAIDTLAGTAVGNWQHSYVQAHANAADGMGMLVPTPSAVTGTFNASIEDFVHLLGAFGADRR